jgi:hypothetical protein
MTNIWWFPLGVVFGLAAKVYDPSPVTWHEFLLLGLFAVFLFLIEYRVNLTRRKPTDEYDPF